MSVTELDDPWFAATQPSKRAQWVRDPSRDVCSHGSPAVAEHDRSVIGPDPLFTLTCGCGSPEIKQVGSYGHPTPGSYKAAQMRARFARRGTGYWG